MAEMCLDCLNKALGTKFKRYHVKFFDGVDICEDCGQPKRLVARFSLLGRIADEIEIRKEYKRK